MPRLSKIVLVTQGPDESGALLRELADAAFDVRAMPSPGAAAEADGEADLVVIDARERSDVSDAVRTCRQVWPEPTTPVLVLNLSDPNAAAAAIDAGATESVADGAHRPVLTAHVNRLLRNRDSMRAVLDLERLRLRRESLARAAADVAAPLGELVDRIEAAMAAPPSEALFDELLDRVSQAMDAVERLRGMAASPPASSDDGPRGA